MNSIKRPGLIWHFSGNRLESCVNKVMNVALRNEIDVLKRLDKQDHRNI